VPGWPGRGFGWCSRSSKSAEPDPHDAADGLSTEVANLAVSYEQLRGRVLAGQPDGWRLGHGLLVGKGMVARRVHHLRVRTRDRDRSA
jgi:hypothetical protein